MHGSLLSPLTSSLSLALCLAGCAAPKYVAQPRAHYQAPSGIVYDSGTFEGDSGARLFEQSWLPTTSPRAALVLMHGLKDHGSRYHAFAERLAAHGYAVYAFDLRGHGYSDGRRVWVDTFDQYVSDLDRFVRRVHERQPNRPIFVFGHSMGGAIVTMLALTRHPDVRGIILSGPALQVTDDVTPFLVRVTRWLGRSNPRLAVLKLPNKSFSRDPEVVAAMSRDPLVYQGAGPARTAAELLGAIDYVQHHMEELTLPVLALHGTEDKLTNPAGSRALAQRAHATDKTLTLYPGLYHDLLHEPEHERIETDIERWMAARP